MEISLLADHPEESEKIAKWYFDEWASIAPDVTLEMVHNNVRQKAQNRTSLPLSLVAHINTELVGVLELKYRENKHYPDYEHWVGGVFVAPIQRSRGVASKLLSKAKETALNLGVKSLYLQCESHNVGFYEYHGFVRLHQARHHDSETTIMIWSGVTE
jgi:putative hydrolase of the HAD superfamily